jgi:pilus assembly protein Flp/PilA
MLADGAIVLTHGGTASMDLHSQRRGLISQPLLLFGLHDGVSRLGRAGTALYGRWRLAVGKASYREQLQFPST